LNIESDNVDADAIWARMTLRERRDFHRFLTSGAVASYLPVWEPWWLHSKANIEVIPSQSEAGIAKITSKRNTPMPLKKIYPSGKLPHKSVSFVLTEVILVHTFLCRLYNGDCLDLMHEYLMRLHQLAPSLCSLSGRSVPKRHSATGEDSKNRTIVLTPSSARPAPGYTNLSQVLGALQLRMSNFRLPCSPQVLIVLLGDLHAVLSNDDHLFRLFAELLDLVRSARKQLQFEDDDEAPISQSQIQAMYKKLQFLQACINPSDPDAQLWRKSVLTTLKSQTTMELCRHVSDFNPDRVVPKDPCSPAAGPNWRHMIRSVCRDGEPLIRDLDEKAQST
uniref:Origin recognition complex subunit 3 n=1 Tax=Echinostoma caproni TaxID=27848 RepID=A0A183AXY8_9TREM